MPWHAGMLLVVVRTDMLSTAGRVMAFVVGKKYSACARLDACASLSIRHGVLCRFSALLHLQLAQARQPLLLQQPS